MVHLVFLDKGNCTEAIEEGDRGRGKHLELVSWGRVLHLHACYADLSCGSSSGNGKHL